MGLFSSNEQTINVKPCQNLFKVRRMSLKQRENECYCANFEQVLSTGLHAKFSISAAGKNLLKVSKIMLKQRPNYFADFEQVFGGWKRTTLNPNSFARFSFVLNKTLSEIRVKPIKM